MFVMRVLAQDQVAGRFYLNPETDFIAENLIHQIAWNVPCLVEDQSIRKDTHEEIKEGDFVKFCFFRICKKWIRSPYFLQDLFFFHKNRLVVRVYKTSISPGHHKVDIHIVILNKNIARDQVEAHDNKPEIPEHGQECIKEFTQGSAKACRIYP